MLTFLQTDQSAMEISVKEAAGKPTVVSSFDSLKRRNRCHFLKAFCALESAEIHSKSYQHICNGGRRGVGGGGGKIHREWTNALFIQFVRFNDILIKKMKSNLVLIPTLSFLACSSFTYYSQVKWSHWPKNTVCNTANVPRSWSGSSSFTFYSCKLGFSWVWFLFLFFLVVRVTKSSCFLTLHLGCLLATQFWLSIALLSHRPGGGRGNEKQKMPIIAWGISAGDRAGVTLQQSSSGKEAVHKQFYGDPGNSKERLLPARLLWYHLLWFLEKSLWNGRG